MCLKGRAPGGIGLRRLATMQHRVTDMVGVLKGNLRFRFNHRGSWFCITQVKTNRVPARPPELKLGRANQEVNDAMSPSYCCRQCRAVEVRRTEATGGRCVGAVVDFFFNGYVMTIKAQMSF